MMLLLLNKQQTTRKDSRGSGEKLALYGDAIDVPSLPRILNEIPSYLPTRIIMGNIDNPRGLIGVYRKFNIPGVGTINDTQKMLADLGYEMCDDVNFKIYSKGGFKMLNVPNDESVDMWLVYNEPWLRQLTDDYADIVVLSDRNNDYLKYVLKEDNTFDIINGERRLTGFGKEIEYMENLVSQGKYQWIDAEGVYRYVGN